GLTLPLILYERSHEIANIHAVCDHLDVGVDAWGTDLGLVEAKRTFRVGCDGDSRLFPEGNRCPSRRVAAGDGHKHGVACRRRRWRPVAVAGRYKRAHRVV